MLISMREIRLFCSKSVNKAPKTDSNFWSKYSFMAFLTIIIEKNAGIKINFLCILLFYEFLMYFLCFLTFCSCCFFSVKFVADILKHNNAKMDFISAIESKNKHIYMNYVKKLQFALILYTKSHFGAILRSDVHVQKVTYAVQDRTPGRQKFGVKMVRRNLKEKSP